MSTKVKLSEIKLGAKVKINGHEYKFAGYDKRKTVFGRQEHFIFTPILKEGERVSKLPERIFERFKFSSVLIKKIKENEFEF